MIEFLWPLAYLLLPLPLMYRQLKKPTQLKKSGAIWVPFFDEINQSIREQDQQRYSKINLKLCFAFLIWSLLLTALARPALVGDEIPIPVEGRDLMMAIDLSGSMGTNDFVFNGKSIDRLSIVKATAEDFIERRKSDRIGLILFSNKAYLQSPLTFDHKTVDTLLDEAQVGLTGQETAIGDAIAIATKRLKDRPAENRVLILLTDGTNNAGVMQPLQAAKLANELGIRIYTIGVGSNQIIQSTNFGQQFISPNADLDEKTLKEIAELTGGQYFRADDLKNLALIYTKLDALEPVSGEPIYLRPAISLFHWPLASAIILAFVLTSILLFPISARNLKFSFRKKSGVIE